MSTVAIRSNAAGMRMMSERRKVVVVVLPFLVATAGCTDAAEDCRSSSGSSLSAGLGGRLGGLSARSQLAATPTSGWSNSMKAMPTNIMRVLAQGCAARV